MFELMPWRKRGGKEISRFGSDLDSSHDRFWDRGSMIPGSILREESLFPEVVLKKNRESEAKKN